MTMTSQFEDMASSPKFFDVFLFVLSNLVTGPTFMSISLLVLELWLFSFVRYWSEIWNSEIPVWVFAKYLKTGRSRNTKFGTDVSNEILLFCNFTFCCKMLGLQLLRFPSYRFRVTAFTVLPFPGWLEREGLPFWGKREEEGGAIPI